MTVHFTKMFKRFGNREILSGVDLILSENKCSILTGKNGAGKTTLMRICAGLEKPESGRILYEGTDESWGRYTGKLFQNTVYLHQQPYMFDGDVIHNLEFGLSKKMSRPDRKKKITEALEWAGLTEIAHNQAKTLSGGERQRVAITRAWLHEPDIMLLDEPTANMDNEARTRTVSLLQNLKKHNIIVLIATHEPEHFYSIADEWLVLTDGRIKNGELPVNRNSNVLQLHKLQYAQAFT
jgi:tungstate transport system ATP-binding protein